MPTNMHSATEMRARAETAFKARSEQRKDAPKAVQEYRQGEQRQLDKLHRLREERLQREKVSL